MTPFDFRYSFNKWDLKKTIRLTALVHVKHFLPELIKKDIKNKRHRTQSKNRAGNNECSHSSKTVAKKVPQFRLQNWYKFPYFSHSLSPKFFDSSILTYARAPIFDWNSFFISKCFFMLLCIKTGVFHNLSTLVCDTFNSSFFLIPGTSGIQFARVF